MEEEKERGQAGEVVVVENFFREVQVGEFQDYLRQFFLG